MSIAQEKLEQIRAQVQSHLDNRQTAELTAARQAALEEFQSRWRRGEPVLVGDMQHALRLKWGPRGFLQRFGAERSLSTSVTARFHSSAIKFSMLRTASTPRSPSFYLQERKLHCGTAPTA